MELILGRVEAHRRQTFRLRRGQALQDVEDAVEFVNGRGYVFFWPIKGILFPSLWMAVAGNRPVPNNHDDPGHVTWQWKDSMLDKRRWYYAKLLRGKAMMVSLAMAPYFYALTENYGEPEQDYLQLYEDGLLSREAKLLYETVLREGPLDTVSLRRAAQMSNKSASSAFNRALTQLQKDWKLLPIGIAASGAWKYSFVYEAVHRYYPELVTAARDISRAAARRALMGCAFDAIGAATERELRKLFQWSPRATAGALEQLEKDGDVLKVTGETARQAIYTLPELVQRSE